MLKRSTKLATMVVASLSLGLTALAMPALDTVITQGYDAEETTFVFGVSPTYDETTGLPTLDCGLNGPFEYTAAEPADGLSYGVVDSLLESGTGGSAEVLFSYEEDQVESNNDTKLAYGVLGAEECLLNAVSVEGPNGQVNHGTVQSSIVHALKDLREQYGLKGIGCLASAFSKLDVGKTDDTKVTTEDAKTASEASATVEPETSSDPLTVMLSTIDASCDKGKDKAPGLSISSDGEKPAKGPAWKTDESVDQPGKGKNKNK